MTPIRTILSLRVPALVAAAGVMVTVAACGGSPASSSTGAASAQAKKPGDAAFRFSACMRSHGLTNFPDPVIKTSAGGTSVGIRVTPGLANSPRFKSAQSACQGILPGGGNGPDGTPAQQQVRTQAMIAFARCLRAHGFPHFPDPDAHGQLSLQTVAAAGINIHTPALLTAGKSCTSATHGQITPAMVVRAINGPH